MSEPTSEPMSPEAQAFEMEITQQFGDHFDVVARGQRISIVFAPPPSPPATPTLPPNSPSTTVSSLDLDMVELFPQPPRITITQPTPSLPPNSPSTTVSSLNMDMVELFPHPPTTKPGGYSLFPSASSSRPPKGFKHVRFNFTDEQIHRNYQPKHKLVSSTVLGEAIDEPETSKGKSVKFQLTAEQMLQQEIAKPKLSALESKIVTVPENVKMPKREIVKSVVRHLLKRGKSCDGEVVTVKMT